VGGALGSCARYATNILALKAFGPSFPWGTFIVNLVGCFVFGALAGLAVSRGTMGPTARLFLLTGVLGGFTTFSSFAFESVDLWRNGGGPAALLNVSSQVLFGMLAVWAGLSLTR
jgi:CrcB protein